MEYKKFVIGPVNVNCIVLYCSSSNDCIVIDPGGYKKEMKSLIKWIKHQKKIVKKILITHGHLDHILGIVQLYNTFPNAKIYLHNEDIFMYESIEAQCKLFGIVLSKKDTYVPKTENIKHNQLLNDNIDKNLSCIVYHTPGHSPGSCCFYFEHANIIFTGDTLFRFNIGRTDLMGGNFNSIISSIKDNLYNLPSETIVIPGHGEKTSIGEEKIHNLFTIDNNKSNTSIEVSETGNNCFCCLPLRNIYLSSSL